MPFLKPNVTIHELSKKSHVEDLAENIPQLFQVLAENIPQLFQVLAKIYSNCSRY